MNLQIISGNEYGDIECYEENGVVYLKLEACARGLGFTTSTLKNGVEYTNIRWNRVDEYLADFGFLPQVAERPEYIPENIFYRLAMKSRNEKAEAFQAWIADEVIPSIRRHGAYMTPKTIKDLINNPDMLVEVAIALRDEQQKRIRAESDLRVAKPKAEYFDDLVDRNMLTGIRETAKELHWKEKKFVEFLIGKGYLYRDQKKKLQPYAEHINTLFELKECKSDKNGWSGTQLFITPKGRETFRLLHKTNDGDN